MEKAKHLRQVAGLKHRQAEAAVRARQIVAPHDGVVVAIFRRPGESVNPPAPVLSIVDDGAVRAVCRIDIVDLWKVKPGQRARVVAEVGGAELPIEQKEFPGRVAFTDSVIDQEEQTCKVLVELENRDGLLPPA